MIDVRHVSNTVPPVTSFCPRRSFSVRNIVSAFWRRFPVVPGRLLFAGAFLLGLGAASLRADDVLWKLDLDDQQLGPAPTFGKGMEIGEDDGRKILVKTDPQTAFFPQNITPRRKARSWNDIGFKVRFREQERFGTSLVVKSSGERGETDYLWYYISIAADEISVSCHGLKDASVAQDDPRRKASVKFSEIGEAPLGLGEWITVEASIGNEAIKVSVDNGDGGNRKAKFAVLPGLGGVMLLATSTVEVALAEVRQLSEAVELSP